MPLRAFCLLLLVAYSSSHARAFEEEGARRQIVAQRASIGELRNQGEGLESRVARLEEALNSQPLLELHSQIENLRLDLNKLQGQIEVLVNENELAQKRQRDFYADLDARLRRIENPGESTTGAEPDASASTAPESDISRPSISRSSAVESSPLTGAGETSSAPRPEAKLDTAIVVPTRPSSMRPQAANTGSAPVENTDSRAYESSFDLFKTGKYKEAISSFNDFLKTYPESNLAASAYYWIGNSYYALRDFSNAVSAQEKLIKSYPNSPKIPDAMLNIASSQQEMNNKTAARKTLEAVVAGYPGSDAAEKAKRRLTSIR
jgi:tol-pal system protein YbgF